VAKRRERTKRGVSALALDGNLLYAAGVFTNAGGEANADYMAFWDGTQWNALGTRRSITLPTPSPSTAHRYTPAAFSQTRAAI